MAFEIVDAPAGRYELLDTPSPPLKIGAEGLPNAVRAVWGDFSPLSQALVGAKAMVVDQPAMRLKQIFAPGGVNGPQWMKDSALTPQDKMEVQANRALLQDSPMALTGGILGMLGTTGNVAQAAYNGITNVASRALPNLLQFLAPTVGAAGVGAGTSLVTDPVLEGESSAKNAATGAVSGMALDAATRGLSRLVQPVTQSPAVANLLNRDIVPTVGQAAGGALNRAEERLSSLPIVGDLIAGARDRARTELGTAAINLKMPTGREVTNPGNIGISEAKSNLSEGYNNLYGNAQIGRDPQLVQDLQNAVRNTTLPLGRDYKSRVNQIIKNEVLGRLPPNGQYPAGKVKDEIESALGQKIRSVGNNPQGQDKAFVEVLEQARNAVRSLANRQAGVDQTERAALDRGWANVKDMEKAARASQANGGVPTPLQIVQSATPNTDLQRLGRDAQQVLGNRVPNSGTTDRALMNYLLLSGGAMGANEYGGKLFGQEGPVVNPAYLGALAVAPLLYSRGGSRYMTGDLIPGQPMLADFLRSSAPYAAEAGALYQR